MDKVAMIKGIRIPTATEIMAADQQLYDDVQVAHYPNTEEEVDDCNNRCTVCEAKAIVHDPITKILASFIDHLGDPVVAVKAGEVFMFGVRMFMVGVIAGQNGGAKESEHGPN